MPTSYRQPSGRGGESGARGHKKNKIHYTYFLMFFVVVYLVAQLIIFFNNDSLSYVVARYGEIAETFQTQGVVIRQEQLVKSPAAGIVQYYYPGGKEVQQGSLVCTLLDDYYGEILEEKINELYAQMQEADSGEYEETFQALDSGISSSLASFLRDKSENNYAALYRLEDELEDTVARRKDLYSLMSNTQITSLLSQQGIYIDEQSSVQSNLYLPEAGIIDYSYDGYEGWSTDQIGADFISNYDASYSYLEIQMQQIEADTPLYRLISSPVWNIVIFVDEEQAQYFSGESSLSFVYNSTETLQGEIESLEQVGDNQYKIVLNINTRVQEFMNDRIANLVFTKNSHSGIKISESCLVQQDYYTIPSSYVVSSGNAKGVLVVGSDGNAAFNEVNIVYNDEEKAYIELPEGLSPGVTIQAENSTDTTTIQQTETLSGVNVVNGGYEQFEVVQVEYQAQGYAIVSGIELYDRIKIN